MDILFEKIEEMYTSGEDIYDIYLEYGVSLDPERFEPDYKYYDATNKCQVTELFDVCYVLKYAKNEFILSDTIPPPTEGDAIERSEIFKEVAKKMSYFKESLETRRVCITPSYQDKPDLQACMSYLQFSVRKNDTLSYDAYDLFCSVKQRSQNIDNFLYDNQTVMLMMQAVMEYLEEEFKLIINSGTIFYDTTSLHKLIK